MNSNMNVTGHKAFLELDMISLGLKSNIYRRKTAQIDGAAVPVCHCTINVRHHLARTRFRIKVFDII